MVRNVEPSGGCMQIAAPQQVTQKTLTLLERQLDDAIAQRAAGVEIGMSSVLIIDSAGLNWLLNAKSRCDVAGIALKLAEPSAIVSDVLVATRLEQRFAIVTASMRGGNGA